MCGVLQLATPKAEVSVVYIQCIAITVLFPIFYDTQIYGEIQIKYKEPLSIVMEIYCFID